MTKTPVAWLNLMHDPRRLATSLAGVGFAVVLIFTELGFLTALLDSAVEPVRRLGRGRRPCLLMVHRDKETLVDAYRFPARRLVDAQACPGVESAKPVFFEVSRSGWHNPVTGQSRNIRVISADSDELLGTLPGSPGAVKRLDRVGNGLFDRKSKQSFGLADLPLEEGESEAVLSRRSIRLVGTFELGTDFVNDGNLVVGLATFDDLFPARRVHDLDVSTVDLGLIRLDEGVDPEEARARLTEALKADAVHIRLLTVGQMIGDERWFPRFWRVLGEEQSFWLDHTPVGLIFVLGVVLGFVVGVVICFQVLSSDIRDHLSEYATLKAIGYGNRYLIKVVFRQASWLAVLGFLPSVACANGLYAVLRWVVGLPMHLKPETVLVVFALTVLMCLSSAYLAIRKLFKADPAELFR
jgi:putative ABC transport system permease protein